MSVISAPWKRGFARLDEDQKNKLVTAIGEKTQSQISFKEVIRVFKKTFISNWSAFLDVWRN